MNILSLTRRTNIPNEIVIDKYIILRFVCLFGLLIIYSLHINMINYSKDRDPVILSITDTFPGPIAQQVNVPGST